MTFETFAIKPFKMVGYFRYCSEMIKKILFELYFKVPKATQEYCASKKNSLPVICLKSRGSLKGLNGMKLIINDQVITQTHLESIWNHLEPSEVSCFSNK